MYLWNGSEIQNVWNGSEIQNVSLEWIRDTEYISGIDQRYRIYLWNRSEIQNISLEWIRDTECISGMDQIQNVPSSGFAWDDNEYGQITVPITDKKFIAISALCERLLSPESGLNTDPEQEKVKKSKRENPERL